MFYVKLGTTLTFHFQRGDVVAELLPTFIWCREGFLRIKGNGESVSDLKTGLRLNKVVAILWVLPKKYMIFTKY